MKINPNDPAMPIIKTYAEHVSIAFSNWRELKEQEHNYRAQRELHPQELYDIWKEEVAHWQPLPEPPKK